MKFKVGDKIICITPFPDDDLFLNKIYTVKRVVHDGDIVYLYEISDGWSDCRFVPVTGLHMALL
jgi:hypothetical protein